MMVTDRFVFLHLHKSGGSFVNACLLRHVPGARQIGSHLPSRLIPGDASQLPVIGLVRNPWSYYVSWFSFQQHRPQPNALFRILSDEGRLDFSATIHRMLDLGLDDALLASVVGSLPEAYGSGGLNLPGFALAQIRGTGLGFYSYLYGYLYADSRRPVHVGRMEELRQEIPRLFIAAGYTASADALQFLQREAPMNRSPHAAYGSYYDPALRDRILAQDVLVIRGHGYAFED